MNYMQSVVPTPNIPCRPGWCLTYVQGAFRAPWAGPSATDAWFNRLNARHEDQNFPDGVACPVWFSMRGEPNGHVAVRMADGSYYSTSHPTALTPFHHPNLQHLLNYYGGRLTVRGWSEDIGGIKVIEGDDMITREQYLVGADAVGTVYGKDFNYDPNRSIDQFVQFLEGQAPRINRDMENAVADGIIGIKNVIGWDGYNSPFVGQKVVTHYPLMVKFWMDQPRAAGESKPTPAPEATQLKPGLYEVK